MTLAIDIALECEAWAEVDGLEDRIEQAIEAAAQEAGVRLADGAEISLLFCDDAAMRTLNRTWRAVDRPTNVLSFPAAEPQALAGAALLGDIAIAHETAVREAVAEGKTLLDHVAHLTVHGFLHLLGHDHVDPGAAAAMEALETKALGRLGIADPYAGTDLVDEIHR